MRIERKKLKKRLFLVCFCISIAVNLIFIRYDIYEFLKPRLIEVEKYNEANKNVDLGLLEKDIVKAGFSIARSRSVLMAWNEESGVAKKIANWNSKRNSEEEKLFNYPRAHLLYALLRYCQAHDPERVKEVKIIFDSYITESGKPTFMLNKLDQVAFGLTSLVLYEVSSEYKYLHFSHLVFDFLSENYLNSNSIISYREGQKNIMNDALGMAVPFLVLYSQTTGDSESLEMAKKQIDEYIRFGVDGTTRLPAHAYNIDTKLKVGSANWGRGIGWYYIGLASLNEFDSNLYGDELQLLSRSVNLLKNKDGLWTQFPGSSNRFDASTTTMFLYCENRIFNTISKSGALSRLLNYIDDEGLILETSGDTYSINSYSNRFGKSELSQAFLILFLSEAK